MKVLVACILSLACCVGLAFSQLTGVGPNGNFYGSPFWSPVLYDALGPGAYLLGGAATDGGYGQEFIFLIVLLALFGMGGNGLFGGNSKNDQVVVVNSGSS